MDGAAVLTAIAYVDLNPIRAKLAETSESSDYTAIAERLAELQGRASLAPATAGFRGGASRAEGANGTVNLLEPTAEDNDRPRLQKEPRMAA